MVVYNIAENFYNSVKRFKRRVAIESRGSGRMEQITYGELGRRVKGAAYFMSSLGIRKSDRVMIILDNRPEWAVLFFASSYIGAVAVPLDPRMTEKDVRNILSDSGARFVFVSKENSPLIESFKSSISVVIVECIKEPVQTEGFKEAPIQPDDLMVILYTSGTTDVPKGVMLTHKNLCANFHSLRKMKIFSHKDVVLSILPLYHSYSLMTTLITPVFSGSRIVYVPFDWPDKLAEYIKGTKTSVFIGVPQIYHMMHTRMMKRLNEAQPLAKLYIKMAVGLRLSRMLLPKIKNTFGKNLRFFISGGAKLDAAVARDFFKLGLKILEGYGLTETSPVVSFNPLRRPKIGSIGKPIPDVEMKIVNKDQNGVGEIAIKGPNIMKGYYKKEAKTREVIKDDWFLSGDLGYVDRDGYFYITGRSKEVIVLSSGKNIYPEEVEKHYSRTSYVKEMCVMGVVKERSGANIEYLHAIIVPDLEFFKDRGEMNIEGVVKNTLDVLSKDIPPYKHIMGFTITSDALPRTVLGKIKRYEVEKKYLPLILKGQREDKVMTLEEKKLLESDVAGKLIMCIKDTLSLDTPIRLSDSIELDLGVDSLGRVELVLAIEKCFDIEIPDEMVSGEIFSVKDLVLKVQQLIKEQKGKIAPQRHEEEKVISWPDVLQKSLPAEFQERILLQPGWSDYVLTFLIKGFISLFFRIFYCLRIEGSQQLPKKGPYILCVNHTSFLDGFIVVASVPFRIELELFFIAFRRYFIVPIVRNFVRRARIIPVDATQIIEAMQGSSFILKRGKILCVFPEGERSIDGRLKEFKKGIGVVAKELDIALVPVYIKGAFQAWPRTERFPKLYPINIKFGNLVSCQALVQKGRVLGAKDDYEAVSLGIRDEMIKLSG